MTVRVKRQSNGRAIVLSVAVEDVETEASVDRLRAVVERGGIWKVRHPLGSAASLFHSRWFAIGWMVAVGAWLLHVGALSLAPLSIVQAVMSGGIVFLAVMGERYFGFRLGRWQWAGVTITAAGLAVIGFTGGGATRPQRSSLAAMLAVECAIVAVAATVLAISAHRSVLHRAEGLLLGLGAGALFGVSNVAIKSSPTPRARSTGC
jgi:drug/metabolite transporter (DMT)-like permease